MTITRTKFVRAIPLTDPAALSDHGWNPGGYVATCSDCGVLHGDTHKASTRCQACASEHAEPDAG